LNLYLMRHGPASWPNWPGADSQRPLTPEGHALIQAEARALAKLGLRLDVVLHSPLVRARETATHVAQALGVSERLQECPPLQPGFDLNRLRYLLREYAQAASVLMVGHMPDMADVTRALTKADVRFSEGTLAYLHIHHPENAPTGALVWLVSAELLARLTSEA
jgi:phosphohistidine phosphatase